MRVKFIIPNCDSICHTVVKSETIKSDSFNLTHTMGQTAEIDPE